MSQMRGAINGPSLGKVLVAGGTPLRGLLEVLKFSSGFG